jgi:adenosylhomocysteine nucleosidase
MKILFVAADRMEFAGTLTQCAGVRKENLSLDWSRRASLNGHDVRLVANGAGKKRAAAAVETGLEQFHADAIVNTGFCGALKPELAIAEIVVATSVTDGVINRTAALPKSGRPFHAGQIVSIDHVAQTAKEKRLLFEGGAIAVEMEAAGIAEKASERDIAFYCIRTISDLATEDMANDFNKVLREDGHFDTIGLLRDTLRKPVVRLPELVRLRSRCVLAARVLGEFIADCRF